MKKVICIFLSIVICFFVVGCGKKCKLCGKTPADNIIPEYKSDALDLPEVYLCDSCYDRIMSKSDSDASSYSNSKDQNPGVNDNNASTNSDYTLTKGVNGTYTYRCNKICSDKCGNPCKTCLMNGKSFNREPKCCFSYSASKPIGWIGCPDCGDVSSEEWFSWYRKALDLK